MTKNVSGTVKKTTKTKAPKSKAKKATANAAAPKGRGRPISTKRREGWNLSVKAIETIAKAAGVSKTTALRYARSQDGVSEATAQTLEMARKEAAK